MMWGRVSLWIFQKKSLLIINVLKIKSLHAGHACSDGVWQGMYFCIQKNERDVNVGIY